MLKRFLCFREEVFTMRKNSVLDEEGRVSNESSTVGLIEVKKRR